MSSVLGSFAHLNRFGESVGQSAVNGCRTVSINNRRVSVTSLVHTYNCPKRLARSSDCVSDTESPIGSTLRVELMTEAEFEHRGSSW